MVIMINKGKAGKRSFLSMICFIRLSLSTKQFISTYIFCTVGIVYLV